MLSADARRAVFAPLGDGLARGDAIVRRLAGAIALGLLADGDRLPPESELAASLNVATSTLRDALADLRRHGLVETRRGRTGGTFVRERPEALDELADARLGRLGTAELRDLGDFRAMLIGAAARLAALRASATEVARLRDYVDRLDHADHADHADGSGDAAARRRVEARFHVELAAASQSVRLTGEVIGLQGQLGQLPWPASGRAGHGRLIGALLGDVVDAVANHDGDLARVCAETSIAAQTRWLIERHLALSGREAVPSPPNR